MEEYRFYFEFKAWEGVVRIHAVQRVGENTRHYFTFVDGHLTGHTLHNCEQIPDGVCFLQLPYDMFEDLKKAIIESVEREGGAPTQQYLRGEIKRLEDEVNWLRSKL